MARKARPIRRARRTRGSSRAARTPVVPGSLPADATLPVPEAEAPHAHAVCRNCGRIADVPLTVSDQGLLSALAESRPSGWRVDGITFSLTGLCARCGSSVGR